MQAQPFNAMKSGGKGDGRKVDARPAAPVQKPKAAAWTIDFDEEPTEPPAFPISERPPSGQTSSFKFFHARGKAAPQILEVEALPDPRPFENAVDEVEAVADRPQPGRPSAAAAPAKGPAPGRGSRFRSPGGRPPAAAAAEDSEEAAQPTFSFVRSSAGRETIGRAEPDVSARSAGTSVGYASGRSSEGLSSCYSAESGRASPAVQWEIPADGDSSALPSSAARRGPPRRPPREAKPVEVGRPPAEKPPSRPSSAPGSAVPATRPAAAAPVVAEGGGAPPQGLLPEGRRQEMEYKRMLIEARQRELAIAQREEELRQEAQRLEELRASTLTQPPKASPYAAPIEPVSPVFVAHCQAQSRTRSPPVTHPAGSSPVHFLDFGSAAPTPARASLSPLHTSPVAPGQGGSHAAAAECPPSPDASVQAALAAQAEAKRKAALKKQREEQKRREEEDRKREEERAWAEAQQKMEEMARKKEEQRRYDAERRRKAEERKQEEKVRLEEARRQEEERKEAEKAQRQEQVRLAAERRREEERQRARQKRVEEEKRKAKAVKDEEVYRQSPPKGTRAHPISPAVQDPATGQWCTGSPVPVRRQTSPDAALSRSKSPPARPQSQPTSPAPETKSAARRSSAAKPYAVASPYTVESPFGVPVSKPAQAVAAPKAPKVSEEIAFQTSAFASGGPPARASRARSPPPRPSAPAAAAVAPVAPPRARSAEPRPVMLKMKGAKASKGESLCNLSVCVRFRPPPPRSEGLEVAWVGEGNTVSMAQARPERITNEKAVFAFENVFLEDENTFEVYDHMCRSAVEGAVRGTNSTVFAYGQTNSGKTYTIGGGDGTPGVIELAAQNIFQQIAEEQAAGGPGCSFKVSSSYVEIYNEQLSDLMRPPKQRRNHQLTILDGPMGVVVDNLLLLPVETEEQVIGLKRKGESYRHVDSNNEHAYASRSHTIFQFHIERTDVLGAGGPTMTKSVLNVVDLAGSEATYLPFKTDGRHHYDPLDRDIPSSFGVDRATAQRKHDFQKQNKEGNNIRCSLLALMRVVRALATRIKSGDQAIHIPYRDSKLTRMLSDAVGGNSETVLICTMNPLEYRETLSTLHFAALAQQVRGTPKPVTMSLSSNEALQQYRGELEKMRALLESEKQRQADLSTQCEEQEREETQQVQYVHVVQELDEEQREAIIAEERERFAQELEAERQRHQQEMQQAVHRLRSASAQLEFEQLKREESVRELGHRLAEAEKEIEQERRRPSIPPSEHEAAVAKQKQAQAKVEELQQQWSTKAEELESLQRAQAQLHANAKSLQDGLQKVAQEREAMMQYIKYKQEKGEKGLGNFFRKVFGKSKLDPQPWERFMPARPPTVVSPSAVPSTAPPAGLGPAAPKAPKPAAAPPPAPATQPVKPPPLQLPPHNFVGPSPSGSDVASSAADSDAGSSDGFERVLYPDAAPSPVKAQAFAGGRSRSPPGAFRRSHSTPAMDPYPSGPPVEHPMDRYSYARSPPSQRGEPSARRRSPQGPRYFPQQRHSCDFSARDADFEAEARPSSRQGFPQYSGGRRPPQETPSPIQHRTPTSGYRGPPRRSLTYNRFDDRLPNPRHSSDASFEDFDRMLR
eukprot:EG_transcript_243